MRELRGVVTGVLLGLLLWGLMGCTVWHYRNARDVSTLDVDRSCEERIRAWTGPRGTRVRGEWRHEP